MDSTPKRVDFHALHCIKRVIMCVFVYCFMSISINYLYQLWIDKTSGWPKTEQHVHTYWFNILKYIISVWKLGTLQNEHKYMYNKKVFLYKENIKFT